MRFLCEVTIASICVIFLCCGLQGCEFIPDDVNVHEVDIPDPSKIDLSDLSNEDTLFLSIPTDFEIAVLNLEGRRVYRSEILIDGKEFTGSHSDPSIEFKLYPTSYTTGVHEIEIDFYLSSGSKSLADILEVEQLKVSKKWKFEVDNLSPTILSILNIAPEDGVLRVDWTPYDRKNFAKYRFYLGCCPFVDIPEVTTTSFYDTTYVGGTKSYKIEAYNYQDHHSTSPAKTFADDGLVLREYKQTGKNFHVRWSKSKYHKAFQFYLVSAPEIGYNKTGVIEIKSDINDTTTVLDGKGVEFGFSKNVRITTLGRGFDFAQPGDFNTYPLEYFEVYQGVKLQKHRIWDYVKSNNSIYSYYGGKYHRLDAETMDTLASNILDNGSLTVSSNGQYAYLTKGSSILKLNPQTLEIEATFATSSLIGQNLSPGIIEITDNNILIAVSYSKAFVIDMNVNQLVYQNTAHDVEMSADSRLFFDGNKIYSYNAGTFNSLVDLTGTSDKVYFNPNFPNEAIILMIQAKKIRIIDPWSNTLIREFSIPPLGTELKIDEKSNLAHLGWGNHNAICDLVTGEIKVIFPYAGSPDIPYRLFNNKLFRNGYFISVDDYIK